MRKKWIAAVFVMALAAVWAVPAAEAGWTQCFKPTGVTVVDNWIPGTICWGFSTDNPAVPFRMEVIRSEKDSTNVWRYYYWTGQSGGLRGKQLVSHHDGVESAANGATVLTSRQILNGDVSLTDALGVNCAGVSNEEGCLWNVGDGS